MFASAQFSKQEGNIYDQGTATKHLSYQDSRMVNLPTSQRQTPYRAWFPRFPSCKVERHKMPYLPVTQETLHTHKSDQATSST